MDPAVKAIGDQTPVKVELEYPHGVRRMTALNRTARITRFDPTVTSHACVHAAHEAAASGHF